MTLLRLVLVISVLFIPSLASAFNDEKFENWLIELKQEAIDRGIRAKTVSRALDDVNFIQRVISSDRKQAEFTEGYQEYLSKRVSPWRIEHGQQYMRSHGNDIKAVTSDYGVPPRFIAAIIGIETNYGTFDLTHSLFDVLATLAYDSRRGQRFRKEIFAALEILDQGFANTDQLKSSWAGALGIPQFMPSTYLQFAVDHDRDGRKDIWNHGPDLYASVANYLAHYGWHENQAWARKVVLPVKKRKALTRDKRNLADPGNCQRYKKDLPGWKMLVDWNDLGVRRMNGASLPKVDIAAALIVTHPELSHGYLVYENFCTIMRYNPSFKYALAVGVLSDQIKYWRR